MCFSAAVIIKAKHILSVYNTSVVGGGGGGSLGTLYLCMYRHAFKAVTIGVAFWIYTTTVFSFFQGLHKTCNYSTLCSECCVS